jgi:hypothetical protein
MDVILDPVRWIWNHICQVVAGVDAFLGTTLTVIIAVIVFIGLVIAIAAGRKDKFEKDVFAAGEEPGGDEQCRRALGGM